MPDGAGVLEHVQFSFLLNGDDVVVREQQGRHITLTSDPYSAAEMRALLNTFIKKLRQEAFPCFETYSYHLNTTFNLKDRFKILFSLTNTENFSSFDNYLQNLKQKAQLEDKFDKLGIDINKDYQKIISKINTRRLANNPVDLDSSKIKKIILN